MATTLVPFGSRSGTFHDFHKEMDDLLGRLMQNFGHCEVLAIFDTCFSGGQANNEKGGLDPARQTAAEDDLLQAFSWYEDKQFGLGTLSVCYPYTVRSFHSYLHLLPSRQGQ